ncbi:hypothetical protein ACEQPO_04855 [Bacillus sp. SL00103]
MKQTQQDSYYSLLYIGQALKKYVDQKVSITVLSSLTYAVGGEPVLYPEMRDPFRTCHGDFTRNTELTLPHS